MQYFLNTSEHTIYHILPIFLEGLGKGCLSLKASPGTEQNSGVGTASLVLAPSWSKEQASWSLGFRPTPSLPSCMILYN